MCLPKRIRKNGSAGRLAHCRYVESDTVVQGGLAVSPAEMMKMAERGIPVSSQNLASFNDGEVNPSWDLPLDQTRGIDVAALWQNSKDIHKKIKSAHVADVAKYDLK